MVFRFMRRALLLHIPDTVLAGNGRGNIKFVVGKVIGRKVGEGDRFKHGQDLCRGD